MATIQLNASKINSSHATKESYDALGRTAQLIKAMQLEKEMGAPEGPHRFLDSQERLSFGEAKNLPRY